MLCILEHSFQIHQQGVHQPLSSATQKYKALDSHGMIEEALEGVFEQYDSASQDQKVEMVTNIILQNHLYVLNTPSSILSINGFIPETLPTKLRK